MENRIDIAELLKDCPKGMELDCSLYDNVTLDCVSFDTVSFDGVYPIKVQTPKGELILNKYGQYFNNDFSKCVIFPKGKTSWEGFVPPCNFKDGDVVTNIEGAIIMYKKISTYGYCGSFVSLDRYNQLVPHYQSYLTDSIRFATEEEKEKLFKAIKDNGYRWNAETKTLEELVEPKFHKGDWIIIDKPCQIISINDNGNYIVQYCDDTKTHLLSKDFCESNFHRWTIQDAKDGDVLTTDTVYFIFKSTDKLFCYMHCNYSVISNDFNTSDTAFVDSEYVHPTTTEQRDILFQKIKEAGYEWKPEAKALAVLVKPKFKVGDRIERFDCRYTITEIRDNYYLTKHGVNIRIDNQDAFELVPNKYDITTLKPFDKVLVRTRSFTPCWTIDFFDGYHPEIGGSFTPFGVTGGKYFQQCIPYEGNEHLRATTNDCDEYYKNW